MRNIPKILFIAITMGLFILRPVPAYADWQGHDDQKHGHDDQKKGHDHEDHHHHDYVNLNFNVWPDSYYYRAPYYPPADEVLVSPPVYQPVVVNGATYYMYNGSYYTYNGYEYQSVAQPVTAPTISTPGVGEVDTYTINIPNNKGGYTAVTLKRSGNGYIGPQGEYYTEFPKVSQLVVIYGNNT